MDPRCRGGRGPGGLGNGRTRVCGGSRVWPSWLCPTKFCGFNLFMGDTRAAREDKRLCYGNPGDYVCSCSESEFDSSTASDYSRSCSECDSHSSRSYSTGSG